MMARSLMADRLEQFLSLTPRQKQMARMYAEGASRQQLADMFCLSDHSIRGHLNIIYKRLGISGPGARNHLGRELAYLIGFVDGHGARRLRMVTHREEAA